ncbi:MAG TPA: hypothetical protein VHC98_03720 [Candidatus Saccharimonadales bacterium]|nr:hypothetical protein [Candidatus Saccharimonadales bacterium]
MSAERLTPKDDLVGLPLPILPNITDLDLNRHHSWHPRYDPMLQSIGGKALRLSRYSLSTGNGMQRTTNNLMDQRYRQTKGSSCA